MKAVSLTVCLFTAASLFGQTPTNYEGPPREIAPLRVISLVDSGWTTPTSTSDCATGWGDDTWNLRLTQPRNLTVTVEDCCCPGDFYEVFVDDKLIGTTPTPSAWGCSKSGTLSSGSFTVALCPGDHVIKVRDAGFDGHSLAEIQQEFMCPAGFTVSGSLGPATPAIAEEVQPKIEAPLDTAARAAELETQLTAVAPYVYLDQNGMERLHADEARHAGISGQTIGLAMRVIAIDNRVIAAAQREEDPHLSRADFEFIEPLFLQQAQTDPCGTRQNPAPCPPRVESGRFFSTQDEVNNFLIGQGYHRTSRYASRALFGRDFTKVVPHACGGSSFRSQAITRKQGECWTYNTQEPEPNPEVLEYIWPRLGWPGYVHWWHIQFC